MLLITKEGSEELAAFTAACSKVQKSTALVNPCTVTTSHGPRLLSETFATHSRMHKVPRDTKLTAMYFIEATEAVDI